VDTKAYIESGIIESYILGVASPEEIAELELLCTQYPEIKAAVDAFALVIEQQAMAGAITPPPAVKENLMQQLAGEFAVNQPATIFTLPTTNANDNISIQPAAGYWKFAAAAAVILLVASAILNFYLYSNYQNTNTKYEALLTEKNSLQASNGAYQTRLNLLQQSMDIVQNPAYTLVALNGLPGKENNHATVYWNSTSHEVYFLSTKMDKVPQDKQYQLWAIVNGKPVDAGLIGDCTDGLCKLKSIEGASAFAITLEPKGGSINPTTSAMFVLGSVNKQS
jgi:anti-sigma-K factor RskA